MTATPREISVEIGSSDAGTATVRFDSASVMSLANYQVAELPQLLSPEEVAHYLGVSSYTIRERLKRGEIPGRKHGARWLIRTRDLIDYVEPNNLT